MKYVYLFQEGNKDMRDLLGGKGANLSEMTCMNLPVPRGFTITTSACKKYYQDNENLAEEIKMEILNSIAKLEEITGKRIGDSSNPLLVSVRSGAPVSMPGMMDTILNLGMNDDVAENFSKASKNPRFVYDSYRRFIQMYADVVKGFPKSSFEHRFDEIKSQKGYSSDTEFTAEDLKEIVAIYKEEYKNLAGSPFPADFHTQLLEAVQAVFRSWNNERAKTYRRLNHISKDLGTAVNVQEMVYGNLGNDSGTGVAFTRNPSTGENNLFGEFLMNAQGEDVVAGIRTPQSIEKLNEIMPNCYQEFLKISKLLENHYRDMQDMEFTIERGKLFILQTRSGKRTTQAAVKIAVDLVKENMITKEEAILRIDAESIDQLLHKNFDANALENTVKIATGLAASPGAAVGKIYFTAEDLKKAHDQGEKELILVRLETSPEDIEGMHLAQGVLTIRGGMTSHAAVVARGMGTCCVSGCESLRIDEANKTLVTKEEKIFHEGDYLSLDGNTGSVYGEKLEVVDPEISGDFETIMNWADSFRTLGIRTNADNGKDALQAKKFGAEGIGICRTEHMFFNEERIFHFRQMIIADTTERRKEALERILPYQKQDFIQLFEVMEGKVVTIRLLDPPLHEFLPKKEEEISALADSLSVDIETLKARISSLKEANPMMGHRGCRLAITYPEIIRMQTKAIITAAIEVIEKNKTVYPEIMIPLVGTLEEMKYVKSIIEDEANSILNQTFVNVDYKIGTMIEVPRASLIADKIAEEAEFFSFGTNDLTQMTFGFSRDDASKFLTDYYDKGILQEDPFKTLDQEGVGTLVKYGCELGRKTRPNISLGICGEHGGDPKTIEFCHKIGLTYVSCSPYRVPIARLAAAQAAIREKENK